MIGDVYSKTSCFDILYHRDDSKTLPHSCLYILMFDVLVVTLSVLVALSTFLADNLLFFVHPESGEKAIKFIN